MSHPLPLQPRVVNNVSAVVVRSGNTSIITIFIGNIRCATASKNGRYSEEQAVRDFRYNPGQYSPLGKHLMPLISANSFRRKVAA